MVFNSLQFAFFLTIVFAIYWFAVNNSKSAQNVLLLIASYVFYVSWDWRFLLILVIVSVTNYLIGILIDNTRHNKMSKIWLITGLAINISVLGVFKYFNFFIDGFIDLVSLFGYDLPGSTLKIVLPVGISFYTFLSISYLIDIRRGTIVSTRDIISVLLALSFFPIILAGPIQRPASLLPQIATKREFDYSQAVNGLKQILWGLFAKIVIADNLAIYVDDIFDNYSLYSGSTLLVGIVFYSVQIYADFSGYSDISIGVARLLGFNLDRNFAYPYFSQNISEFWKRWHISLTTWIRDYVFMPLSFSLSWKIRGERVLLIKKDFFIYVTASIATWFLTGLWHGANYTFIAWGMIHGIFLILHRWQIKPRKRVLKKLGISKDNIALSIVETLLTLCIIALSWVFFKADDINHALLYIERVLSNSIFSIPSFPGMSMSVIIMFFGASLFIFERIGYNQQYAIASLGTKSKRWIRWSFYLILIAAIFILQGQEQQFIYFQF
jgi:alginate O-acetyltransferase complex protein AlgI